MNEFIPTCERRPRVPVNDFGEGFLRILRASEWTFNDARHWICPTCNGEKPEHDPGCEMAEAIGLLELPTFVTLIGNARGLLERCEQLLPWARQAVADAGSHALDERVIRRAENTVARVKGLM